MVVRYCLYLLPAAAAVLCFQILYYQLTVVFLQAFAKAVPGLSNDCYLMVHHTFQSAVLFVPTFILHKLGKADFGYHIKDWKKGTGWFWAAIGFELLTAAVMWLLNGFRLGVAGADTIIFQLFFSGLGEEIAYRSLPLVTFLWFC